VEEMFALVVSGDCVVLVGWPPDIVGCGELDIKNVMRTTYLEQEFSNIQRAMADHTRGITLYARVCKEIKNISCKVCKLFTDLCTLCIQCQMRHCPIAGL
jgi:hypothetical protein